MRKQVLTTATFKLSQRLIYFISIGGTAAITHLLVVYYLVNNQLFYPLIANIIAFLIAFNISFIGHKYLTFSQLHDEKQLKLPHFFLVATSAGLLNEFLYYLLLKLTELNYLFSLILVLGMVSIYTYVVSRFWACR